MSAEAEYIILFHELLLRSNYPEERWKALDLYFFERLGHIVSVAIRYIRKA